MFVERFVRIGEVILFNSKEVKGECDYLIKVSDYMTLHFIKLHLISSGEDP